MKNNKKISSLLLQNYITSNVIAVVIFITFFIVATVIAIISYFPSKIDISILDRDSKLSAKNIINENYKKIDTEEIEKNNGWIEVVDHNFNIIYVKGNKPTENNKYSKKRINNMMINYGENNFVKDKYIYSLAYEDTKDFTLIVYLPSDRFTNRINKRPRVKFKTFIEIVLFLYFMTFIASLVVYARITSKSLTLPLKKLMKGMESISKGNYGTRIELESKNEFGQLKDSLNFMSGKIQQSNILREKSEENRRRIIMDIAHDIKNPLASIIGYSEVLMMDKDLKEDKIEKYLDIIHKNSIRINHLIMDLFEFSKLESSDFKMKFEKTDLCEFLRETIAEYIPIIEEKDFYYDFSIPDKSVFLMMDSKNMYRAIGNLIINSLKYNPPKSKISIILREEKDKVIIVVEDDGIGIPKKLQIDIFSAFVRVDSSRNSKRGGTGLGLAITKSIVEKHEGKIELYSHENKGCKFVITFKK